MKIYKKRFWKKMWWPMTSSSWTSWDLNTEAHWLPSLPPLSICCFPSSFLIRLAPRCPPLYLFRLATKKCPWPKLAVNLLENHWWSNLVCSLQHLATLTCHIGKMTGAQHSYIYSVVSCKPDTLIDEHP